jgi:hypothetical protein
MYYLSNISGFLQPNDLVSFVHTNKLNNKAVPALILAAPQDIEHLKLYITNGYPHLIQEIPELSGHDQSELVTLAIEHDQIGVLNLLTPQLPSYSLEYYLNVAAQHGNLNALEWLRTQDLPRPWGESTLAFSKNLQTIRWLRTRDPPCPIPERFVYETVFLYGSFECFEWFYNQIRFPLNGNMYFRLFKSIGCRDTEEDVVKNIKILNFLKSHNAPGTVDAHLLTTAVCNRHGVTYVKWLKQHHNFEWPPDICASIIRYFLDPDEIIGFLKYVRGVDPPAPWSTGTCAEAVTQNNLQVLKWVRSQKCPWDSQVLENILLGFQDTSEILDWVRKNGLEEIEGYEDYAGDLSTELKEPNYQFGDDDDDDFPPADLY